MQNFTLLKGVLVLLCLMVFWQCKQATSLNQPKVFVRQNIMQLNAQQMASLKKGIEVMMSRDSTDPTSWIYQAKIHGTIAKDPLPTWNKCKHRSYFFLSWHRMYVYYFERILREAAGDPNLTIPYWDYSDPNSSALPEAFRNFPSKPENAVIRAPGLDNGQCCLENYVVSTKMAMQQQLFYSDSTVKDTGRIPGGRTISLSFGGMKVNHPDSMGLYFSAFENQPHNLLHLAVGGFVWDKQDSLKINGIGHMSDPRRAALDPVFWLHHSNIDRLWYCWEQSGKSDPTDDSLWLETYFHFFDENGTLVKMSGKDILDVEHQLFYSY
ncbi:MAG: tyrosinase family protein, partial [Bacteroidota bacterium]